MKEEDLVLCTVTKIEGTTVFVNIEGNGQGTIIFPEIAAGRIRNIREYVVPNKKIVCKILQIFEGHPQLSLRRVTSKEKQEVLEKHDPKSVQVLDKEIALKISSILSDNAARTPIFGPNSLLFFPDRKVAAKTGTTQDFRDGWVVGYTKDIVTGVWVGNNDNSPMNKEPGIVVAGPIWRTFMEYALPLLTP